MFYIIKNNSLNSYADYKYDNECLETDITTKTELDIHPNKVIVQDGVLVLNPNYETEETAKRKANFESEFLELSTNKNFRLQPKGYANAQQSIDTVNNMVNVAGSLTEQIATMVLFYETPDFTKPEQCTEEWLVQHQYSAEPMTKEQWQAFYVDFTTKYAQKMYQQALREQGVI